MSAALVRRGLELLSADLSDGQDGKRKKQKVMKGSSSQKSSKQRLGRPTAGQSRATAKDRRMRSALEEFRRKQKRSQTGVNLQYFLQSHCPAADYDTAKIVKQNSGRQSRNGVEHPEETPRESQTVFTEEQFQQFQREYFGRTVEKQ